MGQHNLSAASRPVMTDFWLAAWAVTLAIGWLLPNHYLPWSAFHFDAWSAVVLSLAAAAVLLRARGPMPCHPAAVLVGAVALVPGLQQLAGMMVFSGNTWVCTAYLLGLLLAVLTGAKWESSSPGQLADGLFLAIVMASIISVGLQLHQWLGFDSFEVWIMPDNFSRPFANFGQPNQLATFLLWGQLALAWGFVRGKISGATAALGSVYLVFGLAMTGSRTAWVGAALLLAGVWIWKRHWARPVPWLVTGLVALFALCVGSLGSLSEWLLIGVAPDLDNPARLATETRPMIWRLFAQAVLHQPWFGYGWNQVTLAHLQVALDRPPVGSLFAHSHNLFLDLFVWCGIPIAVVVSLSLVAWLWARARAVDNPQDAILVLLLVVVANHAMLELPLHYAYFLFPVGMIAGALGVRQSVPVWFHVGRKLVGVLWLIAVVLLALIVRDYSRIEPGFQQLRYEWARIKTTPSAPPEVLILNQWREFIRFARFEPTAGMSEPELAWMRGVVSIHPGAEPFQKMATAAALNGKPEEALWWLLRLERMMPKGQVAIVKRAWGVMSAQDPRIAAVHWP